MQVASRDQAPGGKILLRKTNSKLVYEFTGEVVKLDKPQVVMRGEREISYSKKPVVKFVRKFMYEGDVPDENGVETEPPAKKPRKTKEAKANAPATETAAA